MGQQASSPFNESGQSPTLRSDSSGSQTSTITHRGEQSAFSDPRVRVGCIGVGARLTSLLRLLLWSSSDKVHVVAMTDESEAALRSASQYLKDLIADDTPTYTDYTKMLARDDIDWVLIGSKNCDHLKHCVDSFKSDRHVFCEKPLAITVEQCEQLREAQIKSGKIFMTGFVLRHAPLYKQIHQIVTEEKLLGKIITVEANEILTPAHGGYIFRNWRRFKEQSGPHILEKCCHDIDLLNWIIDSVPTKVCATGGLDIFVPQNKPEDPKVAELYEMWDFAWENVDAFESEKTIEDNLMGTMQYRNGAKVSFHTNCNAAFPQRRMLFCGLKGTLEADLISSHITYQVIGQQRQELDVHAEGGHGGGDDRIVLDLVDIMYDSTKEPETSAEEGFRSAVVCLALDQARREERWVDLEPFWKKLGI